MPALGTSNNRALNKIDPNEVSIYSYLSEESLAQIQELEHLNLEGVDFRNFVPSNYVSLAGSSEQRFSGLLETKGNNTSANIDESRMSAENQEPNELRQATTIYHTVKY